MPKNVFQLYGVDKAGKVVIDFFENRSERAKLTPRSAVVQRGTVSIAGDSLACAVGFRRSLTKNQIKRDQMGLFFTHLSPCLIGMEAYGSAYYWGRKLQQLGHTVRLMAPQFVKLYVKTNKYDAADAEASCEAVARPTMRFVPIKNKEQQAVLALQRVWQGLVRARTVQGNQFRGFHTHCHV